MHILYLKPQHGRFLNTVNTIDPYILLKYDHNLYFSSIAKNIKPGNSAIWSDIFEIPVNLEEKTMIFECWDYNPEDKMERRNIIGSSCLSINEIIESKNKYCRVSLFGKEKNPCGELLFEMEIIKQEKEKENVNENKINEEKTAELQNFNESLNPPFNQELKDALKENESKLN